MNAKKWWAIPLMVIGGFGVLTAIYIESKGGGPFDLRWLAAIALNMAMQPLVWVGIGGIFLWRSGSKQASEAASPPREGQHRGTDAPIASSPTDETPVAPSSASAYPVPSPVQPASAATSPDPSAPRPGGPVRRRPSAAPIRRSNRTGIIVALVIVAVVAVLGVVAYDASRSEEPVASPVPSTVADSGGTTAAPTTTVPATTTEPTETLSSMDAQIRDFLALVSELEENDLHLQASDGESWYLKVDEYGPLAFE